MTREEVKEVLAIIVEAYDNYKPRNISATVDLWAACMADDDSTLIKQALFNYIKTDTSGFAPSIGQLRQSALPKPIDDTEEIIARIRKAVSNGYYHSEAEFAQLPELAQKAVGSADNLKAWAQLEIDELENVILSHVRRSYRTIRDRAETNAKALPITTERLKQLQESRLLLEENTV